ncbi:MAG: S-layer protein [Candidatus Norongarragalinales archaeon]
MNAKRIAAAAAGAAMLGAAFAGAVSVDEAGMSGFQWVSNGSPNVVLVVGSRSMPSDAVAAANVAAMIGNLAYTSGAAVEITGTDLLTCTGGSGGSATTTLTVETPGVNPALAYQIKSYVNDYVDDQADNVRDTTRTLMTTFSSQNATNVSVSGNPNAVTPDDTQVLALPSNGAIANPKGLTIKEDQRVYVSANTVYDTSDDRLEGQSARVAYEVSFADPIPVCLDTTKSQATCSQSDLITKNRIKITFLGDTWVLVPSSSGAATWGLNTDATTSISTIAMGKEVDYKSFMVPGDSTTLSDGKKVVLSDITGIGTGTNTQTRVTFQVYDANGGLLDQTTLYPLETYDKNGVVIFVWDVVGGALGGTNYAEVSLFGNRLVIEDGKKVSGQGDWYAEIQTQNVSTSQGLQKVVLMDTTTIANLAPGDSLQLIKNIPGLKLSFSGIDLKDDDYDNLTFTLQKNATISVASGRTISGDFIQVSSTKSNAFYQSGQTDTSGVSSVYVMVSNFANSSTGTQNYYATTIFYQNSTSEWVAGTNASVAGDQLGVNVSTTTLTYYYSSTETATIRFMQALNGTSSTTLNNDAFVIAVPEGTEDSDTSATVADNGGTAQPYWTIIYDQDARQFVSDINSTTIGTNPFGYEANSATDATGNFLRGAFNSTGGVSFANVEPKYISYRGSVANGFGTDSVSLKYAKKIGHGVYLLTKAGTAGTDNKVTKDFKAGETALDDSGYKVTVDAINAAGAGGAIGGTDNLKVMANGVEVSSLDAVVPLDTSSAPLVVLDTNPLASGSSSVITFGGQMVNSVSASALAGAELTPGSEPVVKVVGSKIVVAGYDAAGTTEAANTLIAWLSDNRDAIRG